MRMPRRPRLHRSAIPRLQREIPREDLHILIRTPIDRVEAEETRAVIAEIVAAAVAAVEEFVDVASAERDETQAVGEEFVGKDGGVAVDFHEIDGEGGDLREHYAPQGVGEGEGGVLEDEIDGRAVGLRTRRVSWE